MPAVAIVGSLPAVIEVKFLPPFAALKKRVRSQDGSAAVIGIGSPHYSCKFSSKLNK
jgi:hypothetical protein